MLYFDLLSTLMISKYTIFLVSNEEVKTTSNATSMDEDSSAKLKSVGNNIVDMQSEMKNTTGSSSFVTVGDYLVDDSRKNYNRLGYGKNDTHGFIDMLTTTEQTTEHKTNIMGPEENEYDIMKVTATLIVKERIVIPSNNTQHFMIQSNKINNTEAPSDSNDEYKYSDKDTDNELHTVSNQLPVQEESSSSKIFDLVSELGKSVFNHQFESYLKNKSEEVEWIVNNNTNPIESSKVGFQRLRNRMTWLPSKTNAVQVDSEIEKQGKFSKGCKYG